MVGSIINPVTDSYHYNPDKHIPDLSSKVIVVTGGNSGTGKASVLHLAKHNPGRLYLAARSKAKYDGAMDEIYKVVPDAKVDYLELDLASFASIKRAADTVLSSNDRLDILINNAGVMGLNPGLTQDGYEIHFGTNHMGHALFTKLLMPLLLETAEQPGSDVRIVNLTSTAHNLAPKGGFQPNTVTTTMADVHSYVRYGQSKMANILFTRKLAKRYPSIKSVAVHPGRVQTPLLDPMFEKKNATVYFQKFYDALASPLTPEQGAYTSLWAATWPKKEDVVNGAHYVPFGKLSAGDKRSRDMALADRLWDWQEEEFKKRGYA